MSAIDRWWETNYPEDLNKNNNIKTGQDYFTVPVVNLKNNQPYSFNFQWVYPDGTVGDWSDGYLAYTSNIAVLPKPKLTSANIAYFQGILKVTWDGTDYNNTSYGNGFSRILIWVRDNTTPGQLFKIVGELSKPGTWSLAVPPKSQTVKLSAISVNGEESAYSDDFTITPVVAAPVAVTSAIPEWSGTNFAVSFTHNPSSAENEYLKEYIVTLVGSNFTKTFSLLPVSGTSQRFSLSLEANRAAFGVSQTSFSGNIKTLDIYGNYGTAVSFSATSYASSLAAPTISATEAINGYSISYTPQTSPDFKEISIEEVVSSSTTDPGTGYAGVAKGSSNPIKVESGVGKRWVRARLIDTIGAFSGYSNSVSVTPVDIVAAAVDALAPDPIQSATAVGAADSSDSGGTLGIITVSVVNAVATVPSDFNGYIVKVIRSSDSKEWTQQLNSKTYLSTLPVNLGIAVGQTYTLSIATTDGRNQSSFVSVTGNPISVADTRTNTTVATNLILSATDSILNVKWTPVNDTNVASYRVQLTTNADTNFASPIQEVYANSNVVSFGGLTASTAYRVRVTSKFGGPAGALSTNHLSGTVTLDSSGAISDGIAPTTNPSITTSNIKSLFGAFAITFPSVTNSDSVTYEVFIKPTNATGIIDAPLTYKVLEVNGTFAVVRTLADKTTALSYGTDYYIAIRAKDNDGISTGTVTAVGPDQTLQVQNADLAADSVYANNIKAGEITASKMTTDLMFVDKTINVGESTSLNRIRLESSITTPVTMNDFPSGTFPVKSRIYIGGGNYYSSGTSFYADNTGRFSLGDKLRFDGTDLTVNGSGTFTGLLTTGTGSSLIKVGTGANGANNGIYIQQGNQFIYTDGTFSFGGGNLTGTNSSVTISGTMTVKGNSELQGDLKLVSPGVFYIGANKASGQRLLINDAGIAAYNSAGTRLFALDTTGAIDAQSGLIAGWTLGTSAISKTSGTNTISLSSSTNSISATGTSYTSGFGLPDANNIVFWAGGSRAETANFWVKSDGSAKLGSVTITGYATSGALDGKINTGGAASDVNSNTTTISGGKIRSGLIQSNNWSGTVTNGSDFSTAGMTIDLSTGAITSKKFRIDVDGNATYLGTLSASNINGGTFSGASINIGNGQFTVSSLGALVAQSANITGQITIDSNNTWGPSGFRMGSAGSYITYTGTTVTLKSGTTSNLDDSAGNPDGGGTTPNSRDVNSEIILNSGSTGLSIKGVPSLGNYTRFAGGGLYTNVEPNDNNYLYGMGRAARLRTIVQDYYDDRLYRGFAVYYGQRNSAPTGSTGLVGDLWVSW